MPTKRTWRERQGVAFPSAYQASELLTGKISYPVLGYDGYGDGVGKDLTAFITDLMRVDWAEHRDALLRFWVSGEYSPPLPNTNLWLFPRAPRGPRRGAWGMLEAPPPIGAAESEDAYLTR